jgi:4-oxalocrotonate tautomerase
MPLIHVSLYPGRTPEQKEKYAKAITDAAVEILKTKPEHVIVVFDEKPKEHWFKSGQQM